MARKKQNIRIVGRDANQRVETAIPKIQSSLGYGKRQATAVAIRMESVGQLAITGQPVRKRQMNKGALSLGAFATSQLLRKREPKRTITRTVEPTPQNSVGQYAKAYFAASPLMFTTKKKRTK